MSALDAEFSALSHPARRDMLASLAGGPQRITELTSSFPMTFAAVSKHLRVLEGAGLIDREVRGREHWFSVRPEALADASGWMIDNSALWQARLDRFKQIVETEMAEESELVARAEIVVGAPPETVFAAWLDPDKASRFYGAGPATVPEFEFEAQPGGKVFVVMQYGEQPVYHRGEVIRIDRPKRLVFTWVSQGTRLRTSVVSIDFAAESAGTRVSLLHEGLGDPEAVAEHASGWQSILEQMAAVAA